MKCPRLLIVVLFPSLLAGAPKDSAAAEAELQNLKPGHPRLFATTEDWHTLKAKSGEDRLLNAMLARIEAEASSLLKTPPVKYEKQGRRLLAVSREVIHRVVHLSFEYRLTTNRVFLERAQQEMLAAAAFKDWNPSHYLDTAEMTAALAIGYDWLYSDLAPDARRVIREAIVEKGLRTGSDPRLPNTGWYRARMNWNQVCFGGLILGALAVADEEPAIAEAMLEQAKANCHNGLQPYAPDGVYPEGPGYWSYGSTYQVVMIAALESALGTDWGLTKSPGFLESARFLVETTGPSGYRYIYSDARGGRTGTEPALTWIARRLHDPGLLYFQRLAQEREFAKNGKEQSDSSRYLPLQAFWWYGPDRAVPPNLPLNWLGKGANPIAVFRGSWTDPNTLFLALKGGGASLSHAHMDAGSFILEADGVRWALDLGAQDYHSLESKKVDLWNSSQDSDRWKIFRLGPFSHNTLTINGQLHQARGRADIIQFAPGPEPFAITELTQIFSHQAETVRRGFKVHPDRTVLVEDELIGLKPGDEVRWALATTAEAQCQGDRAVLRQSGRQLHALYSGQAPAQFETVPIEFRDDPLNAANPNTRLLVVRAKAPASGNLRFGVYLRPGSEPEPRPLVPLGEWKETARN